MPLARRPTSPYYEAAIERGNRLDIPTNNARQGVTGHNIRWVLIISTLGVAVILGIVYLTSIGA